MDNIHAVPEHLPPLPEGEVYLGRGPLRPPSSVTKFEGHATQVNHCKKWSAGIYKGYSTDHYTAPLDSPITRHVLSHRVPDGVPVLPEGYVYAGTLGDYTDYINGLSRAPEHEDDEWLKAKWKGEKGVLQSASAHWHFAAPIDSDIARKLLGLERDTEGDFDREAEPNPKATYWQERATFWRDHALRLGYVPEGEPDTRPPWEDAPDWAEWLAQDADGFWAWFRREPRLGHNEDWVVGEQTALPTWSKAGKGQTNPNWRTTLERRPEGQNIPTADDVRGILTWGVEPESTKVGKLHVEIDASEARRVVDEALEDAFEEIPDMIIPKDAAAQIEAYSFISDLARMGYRLEVDSDGIRGWKED